MMKLHLGCGDAVVEGWVNVDFAPGARFAKIPFFRALNSRFRFFGLDWNRDIFVADLRERFPWGDGSAEHVYSAQMLEHLTKKEGRMFLGECRRVLRAGGVLRIVVPDLGRYVGRYLEGAIRADDFIDGLGVLLDSRSGGPLKRMLLPYVSAPHKCMYDEKTLVAVFEESGFLARPRRPYESEIPDIRAIERDPRIERFLIVEGKKPA